MPRAEPIRARRKGTAREYAEKFGVHPVTVRRMIAVERSVFEQEARDRQEAIRAFKAKHPEMSMRAIAAEFGCSVGTVHRALKAAKEDA